MFLSKMCCLKAAQQPFSMPTAQLSKSGSLYGEFGWRILRRILGVRLADFLSDSAADFPFWSGRFYSGFFAADFSNGIHDPNLSLRNFSAKFPAASLQRTGCDPNRQWYNTKFSTGLLLVLNRVWPPILILFCH